MRQHDPSQLPRRIYMFWDSGFDNAPDIVQFCLRSWRACNPDWDIITLDQAGADRIIERALFPQDMKIAHYADVLRTALLSEGGGVWADASCLCLRPLDHWLPHIFNQCAFFAFHKPGQDRLISSWFLAAGQHSVVIQEMYHMFLSYWKWEPHRGSSPPYFWFHYLFEYLIHNQPNVQAQWSFMPKLSAVPVHQLKRVLTGAVENSSQLRNRIVASPVQKLTHKQDIQVSDVVAFLDELDVAF